MGEVRVGTYGLIEDVGKDEEEDGVEKVDHGDGNVENVGLAVHPWFQDRHSDEEASLDDEQTNRLYLGRALSECNEDGLGKNVAKDGQDKVVCCSAELHVQKPPFVKGLGVRVQNVGGVLVQGDGSLGDTYHLESCPDEGKRHDDKVKEA